MSGRAASAPTPDHPGANARSTLSANAESVAQEPWRCSVKMVAGTDTSVISGSSQPGSLSSLPNVGSNRAQQPPRFAAPCNWTRSSVAAEARSHSRSVSKFASMTRPLLIVIAWPMAWPSPSRTAPSTWFSALLELMIWLPISPTSPPMAPQWLAPPRRNSRKENSADRACRTERNGGTPARSGLVAFPRRCRFNVSEQERHSPPKTPRGDLDRGKRWRLRRRQRNSRRGSTGCR